MYYIQVLVGFCLVPEADQSSGDVSDESYNDDEDEESDIISIYFCAVWTRSCSFVCSIADLQLVYLQELVAPDLYKRQFQLVPFVLLILLVLS